MLNLKFFIITFILFNLIMQPLILLYPSEDKITEVKCYDGNHNEILGQVCLDRVVGYSDNSKIALSFSLLLFSLVFCLIISIEEDEEDIWGYR